MDRLDTVPCAPYQCAASGTAGTAACTTGCKDHKGCVKDSACDRSEAHKAGQGKCIATKDVVTAADETALASAISQVEGGTKTHVLLTGSSYKVNLSFSSTSKVTIIGKGPSSPSLAPKATSTTAQITVKAGANLVLQGVKVSGSTAEGVDCYHDKSSPKGTLVLLESEISENQDLGVSANYCDAELRRNRVSANKGRYGTR